MKRTVVEEEKRPWDDMEEEDLKRDLKSLFEELLLKDIQQQFKGFRSDVFREVSDIRHTISEELTALSPKLLEPLGSMISGANDEGHQKILDRILLLERRQVGLLRLMWVVLALQGVATIGLACAIFLVR